MLKKNDEVYYRDDDGKIHKTHRGTVKKLIHDLSDEIVVEWVQVGNNAGKFLSSYSSEKYFVLISAVDAVDGDNPNFTFSERKHKRRKRT